MLLIKDIGNEDYSDIYIYRRSTTGGENYPVLKASQSNMQSLAWPTYSPDGKWVYFYGSKEKDWTPGKYGEFYLYRVGLKYGTRPKKITDRTYICTPLHFTPEDKILLVKRDASSVRPKYDIVLRDPDSKKIDIVSQINEPISGAVFTPTGDSLLFITDRGVFRRSIEGGKISVDLTWLDMKFPQLSENGKLLKIVNGAGHTLLVNRESGITQYLGSFASSTLSFGNEGKVLVTNGSGAQFNIMELEYLDPQISSKEFKGDLDQ